MAWRFVAQGPKNPTHAVGNIVAAATSGDAALVLLG